MTSSKRGRDNDRTAAVDGDEDEEHHDAAGIALRLSLLREDARMGSSVSQILANLSNKCIHRVLVSLCDRIDKDGILKLNLTRIVSRASINSVNVSHKQAHLLALVSHILSYANSFSVVHIRTLLNQSRKHHLLPAILLAALTFSATVHINPPSNHPLLHPITLFNHWVIREYSRLADLDDDPSNALPSNEEMRPYLVYLQQAVVQSVHPDDSMAVRMADMQIRYDLGLYYVVTENWLQAAAYLRQCVILESLLDDSTASQFLDIKKARLHQLMQLCQRLDQSKTKTLLQEGDAINHHFHLATFLDMRRRTDFGSTFVSLVLQDISTPFQIGTDVRASVMRELFAEADRWLGKGNLTVANKCVGGAVKLAYINALLDVHLGSATMQANLPHVFYRYMQSPGPTGAELVSAVLAILAKYIALPGLPTQHRSMAIRFTWTLVQRGVGTLEAFRGLLNKKLGLFAEMENLDAVAIQRACWIKNANSMSFAIPPQHLNDFLFLKRKLRTSLTDRDFDGLERYFDTAKLFLIAAVEKFCEKNQFTQASQFITYIQKHNQTATSTQPDAASKLHLGLLGWIVTDLARAEGVQTNLVAVKEIYGLMVQSLDWHPGVPADVGTCRLILAVAMREGDASASEFLEAFSAKAEGLLQAKMLGGQPFDRIKVIAVLGKVCRQFVALYRSLTKGMADQGDVHELRFLSTLQPDQMLEIRAFAKDLLQYLAPSLQDAAFVKDFQTQLIALLNTVSNASYNRLIGAIIAGFLSSLQGQATLRVLLRNFGPLSFVICPVEFLAGEEDPWVPRINAFTVSLKDLDIYRQMDGGYLVKFLQRLYALFPERASPTPATTFQPSYCLGDLWFAIGDYKTALKHVVHGLARASAYFTELGPIQSVAGNRSFNARVVHLCVLQGLHAEAVCVAQMAGGGGAVDYAAALASIDVLVDAGGITEGQVYVMFEGIYDMTLLEYLTYSFKRRNRTEYVKAVVRLIGRRELGSSGIEESVQRRYIEGLQRQFLRQLARKIELKY